ncbi:MAG: hypothetical protein E6F97_10175 [Actinobacteria bacterium]|nr:MAG: hypothetical protein E6F97_10175 [Actinomycetota bacterium]
MKFPLALLLLLLLLLVAGCGGTAMRARPAHAWERLPAAPIRIDTSLQSVWTGKELIVSGLRAGADGTYTNATEVVAAYDPAQRSWRRLARPPKMDEYCHRSLAWTGREVVLWGCGQAALDPGTGRWRVLPRPPTGEGIAIWTGRELIGWGGGCCGDAWDGGSAYDPATSSWRTLAHTPLAPAQGALGAWTGHELLLLVNGINPASGKPYPARFARAAAYDPGADRWHRIATPPETGFRLGSAAAWDGHELVVVGAGPDARSTFAYDPATGRWSRRAPSPLGLRNATAFQAGGRLVVWGGAETSRALAYDPASDRWTLLPAAPVHGTEQTAAWAGDHLIVWSDAGGAALSPALERSTR